MIKSKRDELERLARGATEGPWIYKDGLVVRPTDGEHKVCQGIGEAVGYEAGNLSEEDGNYIAAANPQAILELLEYCAEAEEHIRLLLNFVPPWAKHVPKGACPTMYGTATEEGDREIKERVDKAYDFFIRLTQERRDE